MKDKRDSYGLDQSLSNDQNPLLDIPMAPLLLSVLNQAIHDAINLNVNSKHKIEATEWLCDEDNEMLQLCLTACNVDYEYIIKKVAKKGWKIDL
tara:strand:- start:134 stop:415 length:282 start_codon:yes stop_codon:yes gene_type:complete